MDEAVLRRAGRVATGFGLVVLGFVLVILPGPGMVTIAAGLALLSRDFPWAARLLERVRARLPQDRQGKTHRGVVVASMMLAVCSIGVTVAMLFV